MILGIGVDTADISRFETILARGTDAFMMRTFTEAEREAAPPEREKTGEAAASLGTRRYRAEYFAARFAAKEAVFKAVAHLMPEKTFDLRMVETLHEENGRPYVSTDGAFGEVMKQTGVTKVHISITTEGHYATAFAIAEGEAPKQASAIEEGSTE